MMFVSMLGIVYRNVIVTIIVYRRENIIIFVSLSFIALDGLTPYFFIVLIGFGLLFINHCVG